MSNMGYVKALTVTSMQIIITKMRCRIGQSCKIKCDVLIRAGVGEPNCSKNIPNIKVIFNPAPKAPPFQVIFSPYLYFLYLSSCMQNVHCERFCK